MIDTIILLIPPQQFKIVKPNEFTPSVDLIYHNRAIKAVLNPLKVEFKSGIYKPRVTLSRRKNLQGISEIMLTIEFSIPKLMFGNNIEELQQKDFGSVVTKLKTVLFDMGVEIVVQDLQNASVLAIHFSKNIVLTDGSTPFHFIQKIKETAISGRLDNNQTDYRNAGHSFKYHCNSYEMAFYDKIYDLEKSKISRKRAIDPDNFFDLKILNKVRTARKKFELLRMEIRLNKRNKIQSLFFKLKIKGDLTFHRLFRSSIARKVLLHYVSILECKRSSFIDFNPQNDRSMLTMLSLHNPTLKPKQILQFYGLKKALETITLDELKKIIVKNNIYSWNRLIKELETIKMPSSQKPFEIIRTQIERYKPLKLRNTSL